MARTGIGYALGMLGLELGIGLGLGLLRSLITWKAKVAMFPCMWVFCAWSCVACPAHCTSFPCQASIVARTYCDMFVLTKEDFKKVCSGKCPLALLLPLVLLALPCPVKKECLGQPPSRGGEGVGGAFYHLPPHCRCCCMVAGTPRRWEAGLLPAGLLPAAGAQCGPTAAFACCGAKCSACVK